MEATLVVNCPPALHWQGPECECDSYEELARAEVGLPFNAGVAHYQYVYEQCNWNPVTRDQQVKVSFKFDDGSWMRCVPMAVTVQ